MVRGRDNVFLPLRSPSTISFSGLSIFSRTLSSARRADLAVRSVSRGEGLVHGGLGLLQLLTCGLQVFVDDL